MDIPFFVYPFICWWTFGWIVPAIWLLWKMFLEHRVQVSVEYLSSVLLGIYLRAEFMGKMKLPRYFIKWLHHFTFPHMSSNMSLPIYPHPYQLVIILPVFFIIAILLSVNLWFRFGFPLWQMMLNIFLCAFWSCVYHLWVNVYSSPLPNFLLGCLTFCCWVVRVLYVF